MDIACINPFGSMGVAMCLNCGYLAPVATREGDHNHNSNGAGIVYRLLLQDR
ncbi:hypothetical protein [Microcoleus sp. FACHB-68]|uniref:hypothetical protein n=1 Tax=Microcoleus sp. FACHB-68 TaxID=2692826 RepID=UPI001688D323|nr:hypothetical protein [Microcoleus sp. FACHB-68]MBD1936990.1 hypothetical protein [Microcoleus sp. FACHB-68]